MPIGMDILHNDPNKTRWSDCKSLP